METLGQKIRLIRVRKGLTQIDLAAGIVTPSMISQMETDRANPSATVLKRVAERLEVSIEDLLGNTSVNLNYFSRFNMARAMISDGELSGALQLLTMLSDDCDFKVEPFEVAYYHVYCLIQLGMLYEAKSKLDNLAVQADAFGNKTNKTRFHYLNGLYEMRRKCYQLAEYHFTFVVNELLVPYTKEASLLASALQELGRAQQGLGKLNESLQSYNRAVNTLQSLDDLETLAKLYLEMANTCLQTNQLEESAKYAQRAITFAETFSNAHNKLLMQAQIAVVQASTGHMLDVEKTLVQVAEELSTLRKPVDAGVVYAELAKIHVDADRLDQAYETSQRAKSLLPPNHEHYALALRVQAKVAQARKQTDFASKLFRQSADCYKLVGVFREFETTMQELSAHYAQSNDHQQAYQVISDMMTYNLQSREARGIVL